MAKRFVLTLGDELGYRSEAGKSTNIVPFKLTVKEVSRLGIKTVTIKTKIA